MTVLLAQLPEWVMPVSNFGALGICLLFFMWRDLKRDEKRDVRDAQLRDALDRLTRAITLEVLTRPNVVKRAHDEAREINEAIDRYDSKI